MKKVQGKVLWYNREKGYGVIVAQDGSSFFAHISDFKPTLDVRKSSAIKEESIVEFEPDFESLQFQFPRATKIKEV